MQTHSAKQRAIEQLPDNVPMDEIVYRLYVLNKIHQGLDDVDAGRVGSSEALAVSLEQLIGQKAARAKRGPAPKLQQQIERIQKLPRAKQRFVMEMLDTVIQQAGR